MKKFTIRKTELFVIMISLFFLVMNMGIISGGARRKAKEMLCLSRLYKWGQIFQTYANENDGHLTGWHELGPGDETYAPPGYNVTFHEHCWVPRLHKYYGEPFEYEYVDGEWVFNGNWDFCLCPSATKTWADGEYGGPHTGWDFGWLDEFWEFYPYYDSAYGSYGKNCFVTDSQTENGACINGVESYWDTVFVSQAGSVPLFGDCTMTGGFPHHADEIPQDRIRDPFGGGGEICRWVINRHPDGINMLFLDFSARKVNLKYLWQFPWQRGWDYSQAPDPQDPSQWPDWINQLD